MVDSLATVTSMFKIPIHFNKKFSIHDKHHLAAPDNLRYWQVFWDDKKTNNFLQMEDEFLHSHIDDVYDDNDQVIEATEVEVLQLKDNNIPWDLIPLEELFINIGTTDKPKMVKMSKSLSLEMKGKYTALMA